MFQSKSAAARCCELFGTLLILAVIAAEGKTCYRRDVFPDNCDFRLGRRCNNLDFPTATIQAKCTKLDMGCRCKYNNCDPGIRCDLLGDNGATALAKALETNGAVTELTFGLNDIGDNGIIAVAEALRVNTALATLSLRSNNFGNNGTIAIAEALRVNTALATLSLSSYNDIGDNGIIAIAEALKDNTALTTLDLGTGTGDSGAVAIAEALKGNAALTSLDLRYNSIGDSGATAIAEALKNNTALTSLNLKWNNIGDSGAIALAKALETNTALDWLSLGKNNIGKSGVTALRNAAKGKAVKVVGLPLTAGKLAGIIIGVVMFILMTAPYCCGYRYDNLYYDSIKPCLTKRCTERAAARAFGRAHPIIIRTIAGDTYTLIDWGLCKDLKVALCKLAPPDAIGKPATFELLEGLGIVSGDDNSSSSNNNNPKQKVINSKYGSDDRKRMMQASVLAGFNFEFTLVYMDENAPRHVISPAADENSNDRYDAGDQSSNGRYDAADHHHVAPEGAVIIDSVGSGIDDSAFDTSTYTGAFYGHQFGGGTATVQSNQLPYLNETQL